MLPRDKGVKDGRHQEVRYASTCVTEATRERIGGANNVLVEKTRRPDLAWHEATAQNTHEESKG